jgi:GTP:adenosylcobinamide-phosphate guanylyltransferase
MAGVGAAIRAPEGVQAVLLAGHGRASRAVRGGNKAFAHVGGKPMVVHVAEALLHTPEVREVFVVGPTAPLETLLAEYGCAQLAGALSKPLHLVPERGSLYENVWSAFLRTLPPGKPRRDHPILVVPSDIPLVVPEEIADFIAQSRSTGADYALGLSPDFSLAPFAGGDGSPGIQMACFNLREGRFRQNNLHYVKPLRMGNRIYIEAMYENRYQKEFASQLRLALRMLRRELPNLWVLRYYALMHLAGLLDRMGHSRLAGLVRRRIPLRTVERGIGALLRTRFRTVTTALGGAAIDIDNDADLEVADKMIDVWKARQVRRVLDSGGALVSASVPERRRA